MENLGEKATSTRCHAQKALTMNDMLSQGLL
jgi:hypothetical protein